MALNSDIDGAVFQQLRPRLKAISCRIVGSEAEAEDIVQDCFLKWQSADQSALLTPAAWLTTVVQRHSIDRLRRRAREANAALAAAELAPDTALPTPEEQLVRSAELGAALVRLRARLSPSERLALVLHEVFECGHADIAATLATSTENSRQLLVRAKKRLQPERESMQASEKLCRELVREFQAAINGLDRQAVLTLLGEEQPLSVHVAPRLRAMASANDGHYRLAVSS